MSNYYIVDSDTFLAYRDINGTIPMFDTRDAALVYAVTKVSSHMKYSVVRENYWHTAATAKSHNHDYELPVWHNESWYKPSPYYCHVSATNTDNVAYIQSADKGRRGLYTTISPGRFLNKYYSDILTDREIEKFANLHRQKHKIIAEVVFAKTPAEITKAYTMAVSGFESCMQKSINRFESEIHPCSIYGAGDLEVAYITNSRDVMVARALVWRDVNGTGTTRVGRVYGDGFLLRGALSRIGITTRSTSEFYDDMCGARLNKVFTADGDFIVAPYVDGSGSYAKEVDDHLILIDEDEYSDSGEYALHSTTGLTQSAQTCEVCGHRSTNLMEVGSYEDYSTTINVCRSHEVNTTAIIRHLEGGVWTSPSDIDHAICRPMAGRPFVYNPSTTSIVINADYEDIKEVLHTQSVHLERAFTNTIDNRLYYSEYSAQYVLADGNIVNHGYFKAHGGNTSAVDGKLYLNCVQYNNKAYSPEQYAEVISSEKYIDKDAQLFPTPKVWGEPANRVGKIKITKQTIGEMYTKYRDMFNRAMDNTNTLGCVPPGTTIQDQPSTGGWSIDNWVPNRNLMNYANGAYGLGNGPGYVHMNTRTGLYEMCTEVNNPLMATNGTTDDTG